MSGNSGRSGDAGEPIFPKHTKLLLEEELEARDLNGRAQERAPHVFSYLNEHSKIREITYAIKHRVKPFSKIISKVLRNRNSGDETFKISNVTDALGVRIITLYKRDMLGVLQIICSLVDEKAKQGSGEFLFSGVLRAVVYDSGQSGGNFSDMALGAKKIIEEKFRDEDLSCPIEAREAYSSIHLVLYAPGRPNPSHQFGMDDLPVEIQIRTIFEDVWGEIDHALQYEFDREITPEKRVGEDIAIRASLRSNLSILKKFLDASAAYADVIHSTMQPLASAQSKPAKEIKVALDNDKHNAVLLDAAGVEREVIAEVTGLVAKKLDLDKEAYPPSDSRRRRYREVADELSAYYDRTIAGGYRAKQTDSKLALREERALRYVLKMEEALCHLLAGTDKQAEIAIRIYEDLKDQFSESVGLHFRLGEALIKLEKFEEALPELLQAAKLSSQKIQDFVVRLPDDQVPFINKTLPRLIGLAYYQQSVIRGYQRRTAEQMLSLQRAYAATSKSTPLADEQLEQDEKPQILRRNCLVFYATQYYDLATNVSKRRPRILALGKKKIAEDLAKLEELADWNTVSNPSILDTIAYARSILDLKDAKKIADKAIGVLWQPNSDAPVSVATRDRMMTRLVNIRDGRLPSAGTNRDPED
ncbi:MAG TPA: RelA/SpoT domain-containing protein [Rhizomicrobium sp.]